MGSKMWTRPIIILVLAGQLTFCLLVEGLKCQTHEYCCGTVDRTGGVGYRHECTECCDPVGLAVGVIITLAIGIPAAIIIGVVMCCCCYPGCPLNKSRAGQVFVVQQTPSHYHGTSIYVTPNSGMGQQCQGPPGVPVVQGSPHYPLQYGGAAPPGQYPLSPVPGWHGPSLSPNPQNDNPPSYHTLYNYSTK